MREYDIVTVGGGLGGSAIAKAMAERGARVLVVERENQFKDRVRGEALSPWGVAELNNLGLHDLLVSDGANLLRTHRFFLGASQVLERDFLTTTPQKNGWLTFFHPQMQETMIGAAAAAGAEVRRGARVKNVEPVGGGSPARVTVDQRGASEEISARLVVATDGRGSVARQWGGFDSHQDPQKLMFAGLLLDGVSAPKEGFYHFSSPAVGQIGFIFPQGNGRARAYFGFHKDAGLARLQGAVDVPRFLESSLSLGVPPAFYAEAKAAGPLATFEGADSWVEHPYRGGIALVGDAAATSDPTWGQGMSLTLRDVRVLRDCLLAGEDWDKAGHAYAEQHDAYYGVQRMVDGWYADLFMEIGAEADARRARALPLIAEDPTRIPDCPHSGPEAPHDERARRRLFGEE